MKTGEPVTIAAALTAAINATLGILLFVGVEPELVGVLQGAAAAWVIVVALIVRARVTPIDGLRERLEALGPPPHELVVHPPDLLQRAQDALQRPNRLDVRRRR
jgi:hypothetical protein